MRCAITIPAAPSTTIPAAMYRFLIIGRLLQGAVSIHSAESRISV
jgi:hypothetical protein